MKNISFDNPYLLLVAIPLLLLTLVPYLLVIRKSNRSSGTVISLCLHIVIVLLVTLGLAGTVHTRVITKTEVFIVADVSYSSSRNLDLIDEYIANIEDKLPENSRYGIVAFGKTSQLLTPLGGDVLSVKEASIDDSATNISDALDYTATLFSENTIKRIVLISDGKQSENIDGGSFARSVEALYAKDIYIDSVYLDNNVYDGTPEMQISDVDFSPSTYLGKSTTADVLVRSGTDGNAIISVYSDSVKISDRAVYLTRGYNIVNIELPTDRAGSFDYMLELTAGSSDTSPHNNKFYFTQSVSESVNVLLISENHEDEELVRERFSDNVVIDAYIGRSDVPCTVEELCLYDEIVLSDVDVRSLDNFISFVDSLDKVVSLFGKSLVTVGDLKIQNKTDDALSKLEDMLPVKFGNNERDPKLYVIVIDVSLSMEQASHLIMAKSAAKSIMELMSPTDDVAVVGFYGQSYVVHATSSVTDKDEIAKKIDEITAKQGTSIGSGLTKALDFISTGSYSQSQVILLSDGITYSSEADDPVSLAKSLAALGAVTSVINTQHEPGEKTLKNVASAGGGEYYYIESLEELDEFVLSDIADDITESLIEKETEVAIDLKRDPAIDGITSIPNILGYYFAKEKGSANTVLSVQYNKASGTSVRVPLFAYWEYGNGRVSTLTTSLFGDYTSTWRNNDGDLFIENVFSESVPDSRVDYPFTLNVDFDGLLSNIEIVPALIRPDAKVTVTLTSPTGESLTRELVFDSAKYYHSFETDTLGKYLIHIVYETKNLHFEADSVFNLSYSPEYDSFTVFNPSFLEESISDRGTVSTDGVPKLHNDENRIATYKLDFSLPFMIIAIVLYIADLIIRKLRWDDIRSFFGRKKAKEGRR